MSIQKFLMVILTLSAVLSLTACGNRPSKSASSTVNSYSTSPVQTSSAQKTTPQRSSLTTMGKFDHVKTGHEGSSRNQVFTILGKPDKTSKATKKGSNKGSTVYTWNQSQQKNISIDIVKNRAISKNVFQINSSAKITSAQYHQIKKTTHLSAVKQQLGLPAEEMVMGNKGPYSSQTIVYLAKNKQQSYTFNFINQRLADKTASTSKDKTVKSQNTHPIK
ncbi:DUF3862 domain-containing protein [Secundilactobacillus silagei]|uniref:Lipoprotein n=1 Tax=Secundilactobacillus silagei JCM 19001 TaxID=1302250 RepID=A0A1Z5IIW0_9LACO|nr:DUF3862 domain-containing protein [Secundilactobacillus silagei]TDG67428.1 hypothetical protein C5L25_001024 [Secundilactobacillus silagei JCM 19001]GAX01371.1 hypothetical protein IWT126_01398 [Secundilactobacillus silagei JCM 19001]